MKPEIKALWSPDLPEPHDRFVPDDPTNFAVYMIVDIGPDCERGQEQFGFWCETRAAHANRVKDNPLGRSIIVDPYSWELMRATIEQICQSVNGKNWIEVADKLNSHFDYELENYRP